MEKRTRNLRLVGRDEVSLGEIEAIVNAWRSSAGIHADPELLAHLTKRLSVPTGPALRRP
jgi:hypothetical protein